MICSRPLLVFTVTSQQSSIKQIVDYRIVEVSTSEAIAEIFSFRATVWESTGTTSPEAFANGQWNDKCDESAQHWAVYDDNDQLIGAARLTLHDRLEDVHESQEYLRYGLHFDGPIAAPDRVVVSPNAAGMGIGGQLLDKQEAAGIKQGAVAAVRQASAAMCRLIAKRGWELLGPASKDPKFPGETFTVAVKRFH